MQLDLNLLTALDALLEERSVTGAAERLHLTPSAMSRALGRLRRVTGDQILVRTGRTMTPTPLALEMGAEVHTLVQRAHTMLSASRDLDLTTLERTFTVRMNDAITDLVAADLVAELRAHAPAAQLRFLAETSSDTNELRYGEVDLVVGAGTAAASEIRHETVAQDQPVVALGARHARFADGLTLTQYIGADHVTISRRGRLHGPIDDLLDAIGLRRRVVAAVATVTAALRIVRDSDVVVAVPAHMCRAMTDELGLRTHPLPFEVPPVRVVMGWHQRYDDDPAHRWLRGRVRAAVRRAGGDPDEQTAITGRP